MTLALLMLAAVALTDGGTRCGAAAAAAAAELNMIIFLIVIRMDFQFAKIVVQHYSL